jgi:cytoskeleton protein RodZ
MSQLGERLRQARESQGISLAQASQETRILQRYLVALEEGDLAHLPGDVYARGFIRNYASYLGLPAEDVIALYRHERRD